MISRSLWRSRPALVSADQITPLETMTRSEEMSQRSGSASRARRIGLAKASPTIDIELMRSCSTVSSSSTGSKWRPSMVIDAAADHQVADGVEQAGAVHQRGGRQVAGARLGDPVAGRVEVRLGRQALAVGGVEGAEQVVLAPHHALRHAGRAAGVEQHEVVAGAPPRGDGRTVRGRRRGVLVRRRPVRARAVAVVDPQPRADARHAVAQLVDALGERAVEHDGDDVGVVPQVDQLVGGVAVVGVDGRQPGLERAERRLEVLGRVVEVLGDLVLLGDAGVEQRGGDAVGPPVELGPRRRPPGVTLGQRVGLALGQRLEQVREVPTVAHGDHGATLRASVGATRGAGSRSVDTRRALLEAVEGGEHRVRLPDGVPHRLDPPRRPGVRPGGRGVLRALALDDDVVGPRPDLSANVGDLLERRVLALAVVEHLRQQPVPAQRPGHRLRPVQRPDAPDRYAGLLHGVADRRERRRCHPVVRAEVAERLAGPQPGDHVEALVHQFRPHPTVALLAEGVEAAVDGAEAHGQDHPPVRQPVDGGHLAGQLGGTAPRRRGQQRAEADVRRAHGGEGQGDPGVDTPHRLPHEQPVPSGVLGRRGEIADGLGIGPRDHEPEAHGPTLGRTAEQPFRRRSGARVASGTHGLRAPAGRRSPSPGRASVDRRAPVTERPGARRGRLRGAALATAVGARRRPDPPAADRRRADRGRRAPPDQPDRHRVGRSDDPLRRHQGAEGPLPVADPHAARSSGASCSPNRAAAAIWPTSARGPCATATSSSSTGRRSGPAGRSTRGSASSSPAPIRTCPSTRGSPTSSARWTPRGSRSGRSPR